MKQYRHEYGR